MLIWVVRIQGSDIGSASSVIIVFGFDKRVEFFASSCYVFSFRLFPNLRALYRFPFSLLGLLSAFADFLPWTPG